MAGRIVYIWDPKTEALLQRISDVPFDDERVRNVLEKKRYNCPPASHLPVVASRGGHREVVVARWGFPIPQRRNGVFNTRIENVESSPMWRQMWGMGHCVLVVHGFYEWKRDGREKTPFFIHRADGEPMAIGGLIAERMLDGAAKQYFSLVTCPPNEMVAPVHDRMPVILERGQVRRWIDAEATGKTALAELAVPAADDVLAMHRVGPDVGSIQNDRPDLMEPVESQGLGAFA